MSNGNKQTGTSIEQIWICPPLAFARFGQSETPVANFHWAENDYSPRGTAETVIRPTETFEIDGDGNISSTMPDEIIFVDGKKWRPVAPFFEVHGKLSNGYEGPLGLNELKECGLSLADIEWTIESANRKAFHYTLSKDEHVVAKVILKGNEHRRTRLEGVCPKDSSNPLVFNDHPIELGSVQVISPCNKIPGIRLRITPPKGLIYAPTDVASRDLSSLLKPNEDKEKFLNGLRCILNPKSNWPNWSPVDGDSRTNPGGLFAQTPEGSSLGFLDDSNDGMIKVCITGNNVDKGVQEAYARYTCCPPDFQPDRRPFTSIADGLKDLVSREEVLDPTFVEGSQWPETEAEIADLMQRVRETMEASNLDHQNLRSLLANEGITKTNPSYPFEPIAPRPGHPFPLLEAGRANHARFLAYDVFKQRFGQRPELFEKWIRDPTAERTVYNTQMPALMRGSDSYPMCLSQRQHKLMSAWLDVVKNSVAEK